MSKEAVSRKVHKSSTKKHKSVDPKHEDSEQPVRKDEQSYVAEITPPKVEAAEANLKGTYDSVEKSWIWNIETDMRLTVKEFRGQFYVDIRKLWDGKPTKKGVSLSPEIFREIQLWPLEGALRAVRGEK